MLDGKQITEWDRLAEEILEAIQEYPFEVVGFPRKHRYTRLLPKYFITNPLEHGQLSLKQAIADKIASEKNILSLDQESRDLHASALIQDLMASLPVLNTDENKKLLDLLKQKMDLEISTYEGKTPWYKKIAWPYFWRLTEAAKQIKNIKVSREHIHLMSSPAQKDGPNYWRFKHQWPIQKLQNVSPQSIEAVFDNIHQLEPSRKVRHATVTLRNFLAPYIDILKQVEAHRAATLTIPKIQPSPSAPPKALNKKEIEQTLELNTVEDAEKIILTEAKERAEGNPLTEDHLHGAYRKLTLKYHPDKFGGDEKQFKFLGEALEHLKQLLLDGQIKNGIATPSKKPTASKELAEALSLRQQGATTIFNDLEEVNIILRKIKNEQHDYNNEKTSLTRAEKWRKCEAQTHILIGLMWRFRSISSKLSNQRKITDECFDIAMRDNDVTKDAFFGLKTVNYRLLGEYLSLHSVHSSCFKISCQAQDEVKFTLNNESTSTLNAPVWSASNCREIPPVQPSSYTPQPLVAGH